MAQAARRFQDSGTRPHRRRERSLPSRQPEAGRAWYSTERWRRERAAFLRVNPFCAECQQEGKPLHRCLANTVDHIKPHRGDVALFWDQTNWQSCCTSHHSRKTCREDGGFGHRRAE